MGWGLKCNPVRTMEERKEEYDTTQARIFSSPIFYESEDAFAQVASVVISFNVVESEVSRNLNVNKDKSNSNRDIGSSYTVAIFRVREKDLDDLDYQNLKSQIHKLSLIANHKPKSQITILSMEITKYIYINHKSPICRLTVAETWTDGRQRLGLRKVERNLGKKRDKRDGGRAWDFGI
ncbi:Hypothetical predicted protein [Olea europaea subsp. europaea]|uniref:Uncharacterized protein n=1 Tax=Olea europaea subsp. europaea TaxID=158383 RepID=A0A8S0VMC1_OLEEU|nr:Hypothetical predicted protein [Olea europaea subsp. europaea]